MADLEHLEQRLALLERTVDQLKKRLDVPAVPSSTPSYLAPKPALPARPTSMTKYSGARWVVGLGGVFFVYLAPIVGMFALLGLGMIVMALIWPFKQPAPAQPGGSASPGAPPLTHQPRVRSAFEQDLAKHWFSWLGIISLVVGVALFLQYSLRGLGPVGNIITAYAVAGMLFGLWAWFRTRFQGFGFILQSGAWAIVYLATYAFQNVAGGPISSPVVAGALLLLVVIVILIAALEQRSRTLTAGAFLLGFITALTNSVDLFTLGALVALASGLALVATMQRWPMLILWGNMAVYAVHFAWMMNSRTNLSEQAALSAGFLIVEAVIFGLGHWVMKATNANDRLVMGAGTIANLSGFFMLFQMTANSGSSQQIWLATLFLSLVCALLAWAAGLVRDRAWLRPVYIVFAVAFMTIATAQRFDDEARILGWMIEGSALVVAGALMRSWVTRLSGSVVSAIAWLGLIAVIASDRFFGSTDIPARLIFGPLGVLVYTIVALTLRQMRNQLRPGERFAPSIWIDGTIIVALVTAFQQWPSVWGVCLASGIAAGMIVIGTSMRSANGRWGGVLLMIISAVLWVGIVASSSALAGTLNVHSRLLAGLFITGVIYAVAWWLHRRQDVLPPEERRLGEAMAWLGLLGMTTVLAIESPIRLLSVYWALIGIGLYLYGFSQKSVAARRQGLAIIAVTIAKVYIYDVRLLERAYQILSFILLGGILLGIGFLYNRWRQNQTPKPPTP